MDRKIKNEYNSLIKMGLSQDYALLIAKAKHAPHDSDIKELLETLKDETSELYETIKEFKPFHENT